MATLIKVLNSAARRFGVKALIQADDYDGDDMMMMMMSRLRAALVGSFGFKAPFMRTSHVLEWYDKYVCIYRYIYIYLLFVFSDGCGL